jgi:hypothetical protein
LRHAILLLERRRPLVRQPLLLLQPGAVLLRSRLLELDELLLARGGEPRLRPIDLDRLPLCLDLRLRLDDTLVTRLTTHHLLVHSLLLGLLLSPKLRLLLGLPLLGTLRVGLLSLRALLDLLLSLRLLLLSRLVALLLSLLLLGGLLLRLGLPALLALLLLGLLLLLLRLLVVVLLLLLVVVLVLPVLMLVLLILRSSEAGNPGDGESAESQDRALESKKLHYSS